MAGLLRRHGHAAHVPLHRAVRDEPGRQGQVRRPGSAVCRRASAPRSPRCRARRRGLGAGRAARTGRPRGRHRARAEGRPGRRRRRRRPGGRRAGQARRGRGRRAPTTSSRPPATRSRPRSTTPATAVPRATRSTSADSSSTSSPTPSSSTPRRPSCAPRARPILDAVAPTLTGLPNVLRVEGHANHLPVTPGGPWPSNWELSAYRATTVLALPGPRRRARAADVRRRLRLDPAAGARHRPTAITVNRRVDIVVLSNASAEANALLPGIDAAHRRSHAMSTKEKAAETDEAAAKGGKKKLILILLVVLLAAAGAAYFFLFSGGERGGRGAGVQRHRPRPRPGRGQPRRRWLPEDRGGPGADRGGSRAATAAGWTAPRPPTW